MATQPSDVICSMGPGEQYLSSKRLAIPRLTASVPDTARRKVLHSRTIAAELCGDDRRTGHHCTLR
eukprot:1676924-Prymnesium_polylepis.1